MFTQITDAPTWFQEYCVFVADVDSITQVDITDINALWDLNQ